MMQVAFYKGRSRVFNKTVCWYLAGPYSHCELVLSVANGVATCASSSWLDGGVRVKQMRLDPEHWDLVEVPGDIDQAWAWLADHEGDAYDVLGLVGFVWRRQTGDKDKFFCSEAVGAMLGMLEPWRLDPCALYAALSSPALRPGFHAA